MPDLSAYAGVLGNRLAAHLLRRATFGPTKAQILDYATKTPAQAMALLLTNTPITFDPIDPYYTAEPTWINTIPSPTTGSDDVTRRGYVIAWMLDNIRTDNTIRSKMLLFLHQNWMVDDEAWNSHDMYDYLKLLEFYALGSYKTLAKKMCRDNRMLVYLNGYQNTGTNSNENYAREFLELFTIGKGPQIAPGNYTNYTENDIKEAAKLLSGYQYNLSNTNKDAETNIRYCSLNTSRHSTANKTFSPELSGGVALTINGTNTPTGMLNELDQYVNLVFARLETAKNICRKLYRYFVQRDISTSIEADIITPMAINLQNNNYNLSVAVNQLLQSNHFYDLDDGVATDNRIGSKVKSPLDIVMNAVRFFGISPYNFTGNSAVTIWNDFYRIGLREILLRNADMYLFSTTTVAGFPAFYSAPKYDKHWFDISSITQRYYLGRCLLEAKCYPYSTWASLGVQIDIVLWVRNNIAPPNNSTNGSVIVDELINYLLPEIPDAARRSYFLNQTLLGTLSLINWNNEWNNYLSTGNTSVVKPRLELLFKAILYSQEYQLQ
jgi:uncharacterized protein (DUF1800 family)